MSSSSQYTTTIARLEELPGQAEKGVEITLLDDLKVRLGEPRNAQEEELATVVVY